MQNTGWKTLVVDKHCELSLKEGCIKVVSDGSEELYALRQVRDVMITSQQVRVSSSLLQELGIRNIGCVFCDKKKQPTAQIMSLGTHNARQHYLSQSKWGELNKAGIWQCIIKNKIQNQMLVLKKCLIDIPEELNSYLDNVEPDDITGREAMAVRVYFRALFGMDFVRHRSDSINAALNYGYAILASMINRTIISRGYTTAIGIHHYSMENPFNLTYDLIEPFRPIIDELVYENLWNPFDDQYKLQLISVGQIPVRYGKRNMLIATALEQFTDDVIRSMETNQIHIKDLSL